MPVPTMAPLRSEIDILHHCVLVHAECLHDLTLILRGFSKLPSIFDTKYFIFLCMLQIWHNNLILFNDFFLLWVLIITPAENISPSFLSPSQGWLKILLYMCSESRETHQWDQNWASQTEVHKLKTYVVWKVCAQRKFCLLKLSHLLQAALGRACNTDFTS